MSWPALSVTPRTWHEKAVLKFASLRRLTSSHPQPYAWLCLNASPTLLRRGPGRKRWASWEKKRTCGWGALQRQGVSSWKTPPQHLSTSFLVLSPLQRWGNWDRAYFAKSPSHTLSFFLNEDYCEEIILFWMKIGTIYVAAIFKEGIYLLTGVHWLAVFLFLLCNLSKGDTLPQNKVGVNESNILVANRTIPQIIRDSYVITKCSGIFALKKFQCKKWTRRG